MENIRDGKYLIYPNSTYSAPVMANVNYDATFNGYTICFHNEVAAHMNKMCPSSVNTFDEMTRINLSRNELQDIFLYTEQRLNGTRKTSSESVEDMENIIKKLEETVDYDVSKTADYKIKEIVEFTKTLAKNDQITFMTNLRIALDCFLSGTTIISNEEMLQFENMKRIFAEIKEI